MQKPCEEGIGQLWDKSCEERIKELWQELSQAVDYEAYEDLFLATMCSKVFVLIRLLIQGKVYKAQQELWGTSHLLRRSKTAAEKPEILHQALHILDIGYFAWGLGAYSRFFWSLAGNVRCFCDIVELAEEIWHAKESFAPHLSDALLAAYIFMRDLKYIPPARAFRYALKSHSLMYKSGGYPVVYGNMVIGHVLGETAMKKLKGLLRAYVQERNSGAGGRR